MARRRPQRELPSMVEVNVTSLVDVAFTLLVIFIITAPALQVGLDVNLPDANAAPLDVADPLVVTLTAAGQVFIEDTLVPMDGLEAALRSLFGNGRQGLVKADESAPTGLTVRVLMAIETAGGRPSLLTEPPPGERRR